MTDLKNYIRVSFIGMHHICGKSKSRLPCATAVKESRGALSTVFSVYLQAGKDKEGGTRTECAFALVSFQNFEQFTFLFSPSPGHKHFLFLLAFCGENLGKK